MTQHDAAQYVLLTQDLYDDPRRRYKVIFFVPGCEEHDCIIGTFSCEADAEIEAQRFTEALQKIIDAIKG